VLGFSVKITVRVMVRGEVRGVDGTIRLDAKRLRYDKSGSHGSYF